MTMIDGMASIVITSPTYTAADVTRALGIQPDWSAEKGDPRVRKDGAPVSSRRAFHEESVWSLEVDSTPATMMFVHEDDAKGFATLAVLVDRLLGRGPVLAQLRNGYKIQVSWFGTSSTKQVGFTLPVDLMRDLAELGCTVYGNVYPYEGDE
jgi:hypothetical protein